MYESDKNKFFIEGSPFFYYIFCEPTELSDMFYQPTYQFSNERNRIDLIIPIYYWQDL